MLPSPPLKELPRYPVTAGVALAAIGISILWWTGQGIDASIMDDRVWSRWELWRAVTCTLPHVNYFHLAFNLYWIWNLGTLVERVFGGLRWVGIFLLLAFGSGLWEFMLLDGGVGLSGVVYGLWGMLAILAPRDHRFSGAVDGQTNRLFVGWFFLCVFLTITGIMPVGNIAHGMGAVTGVLLGFALAGRGPLKRAAVAGLALVLVSGIAGSTGLWPQVNLSTQAAEMAGYDCLRDHDNASAVKFLERASRSKNAPARAWFNLGIAYQRLNRDDDSLRAFEQAAKMPDSNDEMKTSAHDVKAYLDWKKSRP